VIPGRTAASQAILIREASFFDKNHFHINSLQIVDRCRKALLITVIPVTVSCFDLPYLDLA
jgi:hypothetical protein